MKKDQIVRFLSVLIMSFSFLSVFAHLIEADDAKYLQLPECPQIEWSEAQKADFVVYVNQYANDLKDKDGKLTFQSFPEAVQAVQEHQKTNPNDSITIILNGTFRIEEPVLLENLKGTTEKPILIVSDRIGNAFLSGGSVIMGNGSEFWKKIDESPFFQNEDHRVQAEKLNRRIKSEVRDKIWVGSLDEKKWDHLGDATDLGKRPEFFLIQNGLGVPQTLARFPNEGFLKAGNVLGENKIESWNGPGYKEGIFEYLEENPSHWLDEPDARLFGYWFWDWAESYAKIDSIDPQTKTIKIAKPYHNYGYKNGFRYYAINLLAELDSPGEYYIDRENRLLFWFPGLDDPNEEGIQTILSNFDEPYMLEMRNCSHLILSGIQLQYGRQNAVLIENCDHCFWDRSFVYGFGKDAIHINGGTENGVINSRLECLGGGGLSIQGGDRKTLTPCNHFVENNRIESFSRIQRTYAPAILARGCGIRIAHNEIAHSSSSAMRLEGNDMLVEFNKIQNVVEESDDQGGIDSWYDPSFRGIVIRYNYWGDIVGGTHCGAAGIRLDDMISGFEIYGNVFERCGAVQFGAVQIHGGKDNRVENNVFLDCFAAVSFSRWGDRYLKAMQGSPESLDKSTVSKKIYEDVDIRSPLWQEKYPELKGVFENPDVNVIKNNLIVGCQNLFLRDGGVQDASNNVELTLENPTVLSILNSDLLEKNGLKPIPFDQFGNQLFLFKRLGIVSDKNNKSDLSLFYGDKTLSQYWMFIGTYSWNPNDFMTANQIEKGKGIYAVLFDPEQGTFEGTPRLVAEMNSPSCLTSFQMKSGKTFLYAVEEGNVATNTANVYAFEVDQKNGKLTLLNQKPTGGDWPCHLSVLSARQTLSTIGSDSNESLLLAVANYGGGDFVFFRLNENGSIGEEIDRVRKDGKGANSKRQDGPKAHCVSEGIIATQADSFSKMAIESKLFLNDLGCDKVYVGSLDPETFQFVDDPQTPVLILNPGAGPRHLTHSFLSPLVIVNNELDSTITPFLFADNSVQMLGNWSTLPEKYQGKTTDDPALVDGNKFLLANTTSEIESRPCLFFPINQFYYSFCPKLSENKKQSYFQPIRGVIYVSNRGDDSIAVFQYQLDFQMGGIKEVPSGIKIEKADDQFQCELKQVQPTLGKTPRFFAIDPSNQYFIVCNQDSASIVLFKIHYQTGELIKASTQEPICVSFPVSLAFVRKIRLDEI
ncbi:MAG: beta-propeller fold lactonase family protein [Planctomycetia bacterium]|nr:beta-propeller fold lactonase family protein [Planctomycetia bacterium]